MQQLKLGSGSSQKPRTGLTIPKVRCPYCDNLVFKTAVCSCGQVLDSTLVMTDEDVIKDTVINLPKPITDILEAWFLEYYKNNSEMLKTHVSLASKLGFIVGCDDD